MGRLHTGRRRVLAMLAFVIPSLSGSSDVGAFLLTNGGFEAPFNPPAPGNLLNIGPGQETTLGFAGWNITDGNVDLIDASAPFLPVDWGAESTIDGSQILDLSGTVGGTIAQDFATTTGDTFRVSLWFTNNPLGGFAAGLVTIEDATLNAALISNVPLFHGTATVTSPDWTFFQVEFIALSALSRVVISTNPALNDPSGGIILDAVSAVPEPTLTGAALLLAGVLPRRRPTPHLRASRPRL